ncbi:MAG TPA: hypothetical protein VI461_14380 [Chitinophagaceae bacterium]|nr:hypothetical protein [Chitinophagaceae bacterium]
MRSACIIILFLLAFGQTNSQECKGFYYMSNGEVQMTVYDKKGEENGKVTYHISDAAASGSAMTANFTSEMVNEKGKTLSKGSGKYKCTGGVFYADAKVAMPQENMAAYKDMDVKAEDVFIEYPSSMAAGQALKDVNFKMEVFNKGALFATITFDELNRKVESKESITSPSGTWDCWKITYDVKFKASMAPLNIGIPLNMQITEWFAPGFGVVKTETYNKNGKLMGSTLITSVKK